MASEAMGITRHNGRAAARPERTGRVVNVNETERLLSLVGGGLLALYGVTRPWPRGLLLTALGAGLMYRGASGHCDVYGALGISTAAQPHAPATSVPAGRGVKVVKSVFVNRAPEEVYRFWRNLANLPRFMHHLHAVTVQGDRSHWVARGPLGMRVEWDAAIINDQRHEVLAWRSLPGSQVDSAGSVHFQPEAGGRGTRVTVTLKYDPPAGKVGAAFAHLFGRDPDTQIEEDLRRFKQLMEAGEWPSTYGQPTGRRW